MESNGGDTNRSSKAMSAKDKKKLRDKKRKFF